jgi:hypothetical protein
MRRRYLLPMLLVFVFLPAVIEAQEASQSKPQSATLEYDDYTVPLTEIDGQAVRFDPGRSAKNHYILEPGVHQVHFAHHDHWSDRDVRFEALPGTVYRVIVKELCYREFSGAEKTLYYYYMVPMVFEIVKGKVGPCVSGAMDEFKPVVDSEKHMLLYEDAALPVDQTARLFYSEGYLHVAKISGRGGDTNVRFRKKLFQDRKKYRLLPGDYELELEAEESMVMTGDRVVSWELLGSINLPLKAQAGRIYKINVDIDIPKSGGTIIAPYKASIEDVTEKTGGKK